MTTYQQRDILTSSDGNLRWRVILKRVNRTYLFSMDNEKAFPERHETIDVQSRIDAVDLVVQSPTHSRAGVATVKQARHAAEKFKRFEPVLNYRSRPRLLSQAGRAQAYDDLLKTYQGLTYKVFIKALRDFWHGGETEDAFTPNWSNCGGGTKINIDMLNDEPLPAAKKHLRALAIEASKRVLQPRDELPDCTVKGFPRKRNAAVRPTAFRVDRQVLRVFKHYYDWKLKNPGSSLEVAYQKMRREVLVMPSGDGTKGLIPERALPELHVFQHWFYKLIDYKTRRCSAVGETAFNQNEKGITGDERSSAGAGGDLGSGDATIWNTAIRSRLPARRAIGCPVVYRIRCARTGMLFGISVSLEAASWDLAAAAIANCVEDKVEFCKRYGIDIQHEDWPIAGLPGEFKFDRGETYNFKADDFKRVTGIAVTHLVGQAPQDKGGSESDFRTLQIRLTGQTPGALITTWEKAKSQKWKLEGNNDLDQFMATLLRHELDRMKKPRDDMELPAQMVADGGTSSPLDFWNYSLAHEGGGLSSFSLDEVQLSLMSEATAMLTGRAIVFRGCVYLSDEIERLYPYAKARRHGYTKLHIKFDERLVDQIYVVAIGDQELDQPVMCGLNHQLEHQSTYFGKCFKEIVQKRRDQGVNTAKAKPQTTDSAMKTSAAHLKINAEAKAMTDAAPDQGSVASQLAAMKAHRREDSLAHMPKDAFKPSVARAASATAPAVTAPATLPPACSPAPNPLLSLPDEEDEFLVGATDL